MYFLVGVFSLRSFILSNKLNTFSKHFVISSNNLNILKSNDFMNMNDSIFNGKIDVHKSVIIESKENDCPVPEEFRKKLETSLHRWREDKIRAVQFKIDIPQVNWIPILVEKGFKIHNARDQLITLFLWLPENEPEKLPNYAHYMVGAGAVVINDKQQILVVRERYRAVPFWKLPGGFIDPGEDIAEGAMREVLEETSVQTEFLSLVAIRRSKGIFGCSDMYIIMRLKPLSSDIQKEDCEIEDCKWMEINEYLNHPEVHENNRMFVRQALENEKDGIIVRRELQPHPVTKAPQCLYSINKVNPDAFK